ncbi:BatA domain-containing protein [Stieleria varia]|uniref:VWFA domain-containing protein n=1 Tax=Stieleria varia TaxID=2528005 RepID=A0A5C6ASA0_9BACT|nr:BatA domain-containing protein [Stieleria varia]TWU02408.1 hypothetical protein Pla52n_34580 [Stieleria varia]
MSLLTPLYLLGALAIGLPILFHLIRRRPKGEVVFSSLMFLQPTPPRLTRRSRLENLPLLIARALALLLLAAAFSRPFFRQTTSTETDRVGKRIVVLVDTSASMRRAGVWQNAMDRATETIDSLDAADQIAVIAFDRQPRPVITLADSAELPSLQRASAAKEQIRALQPTWNATDLASAISTAAEMAVSSNFAERPDEALSTSRVVLISDMQSGAATQALQTFDWPKDLSLQVINVADTSPTNASLQILASTENDAVDDNSLRVRVSNSADSTTSQFQLQWRGKEFDRKDDDARRSQTAADRSSELGLPIQVPPGQTRVATIPLPKSDSHNRLVLSGDAQDFDNVCYYAITPQSAAEIIYLGQPPAENLTAESARESLLYYLDRVPLSDARVSVRVVPLRAEQFNGDTDPKQTPLVVVSEALDLETAQRLKQYAEQGGQVCVVLGQPSTGSEAIGLQTLLDSPELTVTEAEIDDYVMLTSIRFSDPVFSAMADPQFNDFTKVRFWHHRNVSGLADDCQTLAEFDDESPAVVRRPLGRGSVVLMTAGWQPSESQLALSTKFIPMISGLFQPSPIASGQSFIAGEPVDLSIVGIGKLTMPSGEEVSIENPSDFAVIDGPGLYQYSDDEGDKTFAVNLSESESLTSPMGSDTLERLGVRLGKPSAEIVDAAAQRQLRDVEMEDQQRVWQWLLMFAFAAIAIETWWSRQRPTIVAADG